MRSEDDKEQQMQTYLSLCTEFYDIDKPLAPERELAFYMDYAKNANGGVLEPMCGTGRFLIPMLEAGIEIEGFDASVFMLDVLYKKCAAKNLVPKVWRQFLEDLNLQKCYGLIFIPSGSFGLITNLDEVRLCLKKILDHLRAGGTFVFEVETLKTPLAEMRTGKVSVTRPDGKKITLETLSQLLTSNVVSSTFQYQLLEGETILKTETEEFKVRLYDPNELEELIKNTGFTHVKRIKAFDNNQKASDEDIVMVIECRK